jgi:hypothetical protein
MIGYWFLVDAGGWQPPEELLRFLEAGEKPVSIGFGSMTGREPQKTTELIIEAVGRAVSARFYWQAGRALGTLACPTASFVFPPPRVAGCSHE